MPTLQTRCSVQTKSCFGALASSAGLTESMLLRRMVAAVVAGTDFAMPRSDTCGGQGGRSGRIMLRLRPHEVVAVRMLAEQEGHSAPAWIVRQVRHRIEGAVPFAREELEAQHAAIRELSAVGRNLNSITHRLLRSGQFDGTHLHLEALAKAVDRVRREMTATTTRASQRAHRGEG